MHSRPGFKAPPKAPTTTTSLQDDSENVTVEGTLSQSSIALFSTTYSDVTVTLDLPRHIATAFCSEEAYVIYGTPSLQHAYMCGVAGGDLMTYLLCQAVGVTLHDNRTLYNSNPIRFDSLGSMKMFVSSLVTNVNA